MIKRFLPVVVFIVVSPLFARSSVWKVEGEGTILYLGGTAHQLRSEDYPLPPEYEKAYAASDILVFESYMGKQKEAEMNRLLMQEMSKAPAMKSVLSRKRMKQVRKLFKKEFSMSRDTVESMSVPLAVLVLDNRRLQKRGFTQEGVDKLFQGRAGADEKPMHGLETKEQQIEYLVNMGKGDEERLITYTLKEFESEENTTAQVMDAWKVGDIDKVNTLNNMKLKEEFPNIHQVLQVERNKVWMPKILDYLKTRETEFILVGVSHMAGEEGILNALKKEGYTVTQL